MTLFNPYAGEGDVIETAPFPRSPPRKEKPTSPEGTTSSGRQRALLLRARATIVETVEFVKSVRKVIKRKQTISAAGADVNRVFNDKLDP